MPGKKLRLLLTEECNRNCAGCCNKDWDLKSLPVVNPDDYHKYDEVLLTGGEPMLDITKILSVVKDIRRVSHALIYLYTAEVAFPYTLCDLVVSKLDGITLTLHTPNDRELFGRLNAVFLSARDLLRSKSLRLNVFDSIEIDPDSYPLWKIKSGMRWIKNCPLPDNEVFMRLEEP